MPIQLNKRPEEKSLFREGVLGDIDLSEFIVLWTHMFPMDKIYREKYGIPFNSEQHRQLSPIDMIVELGQDAAIKYSLEKEIESKKDPADKYFPGRGKYFKVSRSVSKLNQDEIDKAFEQIDIEDVKYNEDGTITL